MLLHPTDSCFSPLNLSNKIQPLKHQIIRERKRSSQPFFSGRRKNLTQNCDTIQVTKGLPFLSIIHHLTMKLQLLTEYFGSSFKAPISTFGTILNYCALHNCFQHHLPLQTVFKLALSHTLKHEQLPPLLFFKSDIRLCWICTKWTMQLTELWINEQLFHAVYSLKVSHF